MTSVFGIGLSFDDSYLTPPEVCGQGLMDPALLYLQEKEPLFFWVIEKAQMIPFFRTTTSALTLLIPKNLSVNDIARMDVADAKRYVQGVMLQGNYLQADLQSSPRQRVFLPFSPAESSFLDLITSSRKTRRTHVNTLSNLILEFDIAWPLGTIHHIEHHPFYYPNTECIPRPYSLLCP